MHARGRDDPRIACLVAEQGELTIPRFLCVRQNTARGVTYNTAYQNLNIPTLRVQKSTARMLRLLHNWNTVIRIQNAKNPEMNAGVSVGA